MFGKSEDLATWASILGSVAALLGLFQSQSWLVALGLSFVGISFAAIAYARRNRMLLQTASINVEGLNLDCLNIANLRRRLNKSLTVQRAYHFAKIEGQDVTISWQYDGFGRSKSATNIEFSIDTENNVPFNELDCFAFHLNHDPEKTHRIRPVLVGADGLSKKVAVPFLKPCFADQPFSVLLNCHIPGCVGTGPQYYTASLSFAQRYVDKVAVHLMFVRHSPDWVRVYECDRNGKPALVRELAPSRTEGDVREYIDLLEQVPGQFVRIYIYHLPNTEQSPRLHGKFPPKALT